jgi:hypothetical protein
MGHSKGEGSDTSGQRTALRSGSNPCYPRAQATLYFTTYARRVAPMQTRRRLPASRSYEWYRRLLTEYFGVLKRTVEYC